jgi:diguanylate cyclase (GGDEF)-like protein/putative nucleotidyltransferase with HDIG domain
VHNTIARTFADRARHEGSQAARGPTFGTLPVGARVLIAGTTAASLLHLIWTAPSARFDSPETFLGLLLASVALAASKVPLPLLPTSATLSLSYCTNFAALVLLPPFEATLVVAAGAWSQCVLNTAGQTPVHRTVFSVANVMLSSQVAALAAEMAGGYDPRNVLALGSPTLAAATAFFLCNSILMSLAVAGATRTSMWPLWRDQFLWSAPVCFIGAMVGSVGAYLVANSYSGAAILGLPPLYLVYLSYKTYLRRVTDQQQHLEEVSALHLASVEALARAIGARDQTLEASRLASDTHVRRVQKLAVRLAQAAGMSENEVKGVEVAALLHDIGKLAVPEHILTKPGRLTSDEFQAIRLHPSVGAEIIKAVPFPYPVAPLIESHHERWDGSGYPLGLAGTDIPLGARILGIVDYFDALIADRPYHKAITEPEATAIIQGEAGRALDPDLVEKFLAIVREVPAPPPSPAAPRAAGVGARSPVGRPATGLVATEVAAEGVQSALENITRANQEMRALYEVAEAMGTRLSVADTMALLAAKLTPLVPASSWTLYLYDPATGVSRCEFATGLDSDLLRQVEVPFGAGAIGWMARRAEPIVNARPGADFEAARVKGASSTLKSMVAFPLVVRDRFIGALAAYHVEPDHFTAAHLRVLDRVSAQAAKVVQDALVFEQIRSDSLTDSLTGLANSRAFIDHAEREMAKADRQDTQRALLVIDVDRFKAINDRYGHDVGDQALRAIGNAIRQAVRSYDFCARNGGDEFVVFLAECDDIQAGERAREIQTAVETLAFEATSGSEVRLGISIGWAVYPRDGHSYEALVKKADRRMYQNKSARKSHPGAAAGPRSLTAH